MVSLDNGLFLRVGNVRENAAQKSRRLLAEARVLIRRVSDGEVDAIVRGDSGVRTVSCRFGEWACSCPGKRDTCSHVRAVRSCVWIGAEHD